jgi:hypothetical protein
MTVSLEDQSFLALHTNAGFPYVLLLHRFEDWSCYGKPTFGLRDVPIWRGKAFLGSNSLVEKRSCMWSEQKATVRISRAFDVENGKCFTGSALAFGSTFRSLTLKWRDIEP